MESILVLSDTHGATNLLEKVLNLWEKKCCAIIFLGDGASDIKSSPRYSEIKDKTFLVRGNNDWDGTLKRECILNINSHKIFFTHGNYYGVYHTMSLLSDAAKKNNCDIALFGHTHIPCEEFQKGLYLMNPGSLGYPRYGQKPSFALLQISQDAVYSTFFQWINTNNGGEFTQWTPVSF